MRLVKNLKKLYRLLLRNLIAILPYNLKGHLIRNFVSLNYFPQDNLIFKVAETEQELESAFQLLHDSYVASGFMQPHQSGLRATVFHALPTTTTLIAKVDNKVVGTLSIVQDSSLGLPLEKAFDLQLLKNKSPHIAEISALAIHPEYRGNRGLLFLLTKFMYEYSLNSFYLDYWVIAVNPMHKDLYEHIFLFNPLIGGIKKVENYSFANNQPAVAYYADIKLLRKKFFLKYAKKPVDKNMYDYFANPAIQMKNFKMPERLIQKSFDAVLDYKIFKSIFVDKVNLVESLSVEERIGLRLHYNDVPEIQNLIPLPSNVKEFKPRRGHTRFKVVCDGYIQEKESSYASRVEVLDISISGFRARINDITFLKMNNIYIIKIKLGPFEVESLEARLVSINDSGSLGFTVERNNESWVYVISQLFQNLYKKQSNKKLQDNSLAALDSEEFSKLIS